MPLAIISAAPPIAVIDRDLAAARAGIDDHRVVAGDEVDRRASWSPP